MSKNLFFKTSFFQQNRQALLKQLPASAVVVLPAHTRVQRSRDTTYPFRQESNFWYLTGITEPDYLVVMSEKETYLITPSQLAHHEVFDGSADLEELTQVSGIADIYAEPDGWQKLLQKLNHTKSVYTLAHSALFDTHTNQQVNLGRYRFLQRLKRNVPKIKTTDISQELINLRCIKKPSELRAIEQAIKVTSEPFQRLEERGYKSFRYEHQVEAEFTYYYRQHNAQHGYEPIVASGKNACTLHYVKNDAPLEQGQLLLIDTGAEVEHYSADITRVVPVGHVSERSKQVYQEVLGLQQVAIELFHPGVSLRDIEITFEKMMGASLRRLGLIAGNNRSDIRTYYPHALSHFLGLDVHDVGNTSEPLQQDMVLTVEPGIYIPEEGIGVRIEDDVRITKKGNHVLSADCPKLADF